MMYDNPHYMSMGSGWILMFLLLVLPLLALAIAVVAVPAWRPFRGSGTTTDDVGAEAVLADRLARGDIDTEEYEQRLRTLRAAPR